MTREALERDIFITKIMNKEIRREILRSTVDP